MTEQRYEYSEHLWITTGVPGDDQQSDFMNATWQEAGEGLVFSVACHIGIPAGVTDEVQLREVLRLTLQRAVEATGGDLNFEVQLGPAGDGEGFECEHCGDGDALRAGEECAYCGEDGD